MQTRTGKRKRISFAENVEAVENNSEAIQSHKKKKLKKVRKEEEATKIITDDNVATKSESSETAAAPDLGSDVWSQILSTSKELGINYEDAIKNILLEKLGAVVADPTNGALLNDYDEFMRELSIMFGKLHRFPKMISKFLFCLRQDIVSCFETIDSKQRSKHKLWTELVLPPKFMASVAPAVSLLPTGQIIDLWKTIHHNLDEECVKKIFDEEDKVGIRYFLDIVVELLSEFLASIKVADSSVPITQIEKMSELVVKLQDDCLAKLGDALVKKSDDSKLLSSFLKLAHTWAELHALLLLYNPKYKVKNGISSIISFETSNSSLDDKLLGDSTAAFNLTCIHPYLDEASWLSLGQDIVGSGDASNIILLVKLVSQKMKYLQIVDGRFKYYESDKDPGRIKAVLLKIGKHLEGCAEFIWLNPSRPEEWLSIPETEQVFPLASEYLPPLKMIELANNFMRKIDSTYKRKAGRMSNNLISGNGLESGVDSEALALLEAVKEEEVESSSSIEIMKVVTRDSNNWMMTLTNDNPVFCSAVILQVTGEIIRRLSKMKVEKKFLKSLSHNVLTSENQAALLRSFTLLTRGDYSLGGSSSMDETILNSYLNFVNDFIEDHVSDSRGNNSSSSSSSSNNEFSSDLILNLLEFLNELPLEEFPKELKTFLCLFSISIFITISTTTEEEVEGSISQLDSLRQLVGNLVWKSAWNAKGNSVLFGVKWHKLFHWIRGNVTDPSVVKILVKICLRNIYISPKFVEEFQPIFDTLCEEMTLDSSVGNVGLNTLEFFAEELTASGSSKSKLTPIIENHTRKLTQLVVKILEQLPAQNDIDGLIETIDQSQAEDKLDTSAQSLERVFRACLLSRLALKALLALNKGKKGSEANEGEKKQEEEEDKDVKSFKAIITPVLQSAVTFLKKCQKNKMMRKLLKTREELIRARSSAWAFLYCICEGAVDEFQSQVPNDFMKKLWSLCLGLKGNIVEKGSTLGSAVSLPKVIYQVCSVDEFGVIAESIIEEMATLSSPDGQRDETKLAILTHLVDNLIDIDLVLEKKQLRTKILEEYLSNFLQTTLHWKEFSYLNYLPVLDLQLKILRRRNALCGLESLANCFVSITAVPLKAIEDVSVFKKVFCKAADLLNAFTYNRIDVVSFRTHVALQCFETLVQNLTERADQKHKLTDGEIFDLRYCAHSVERICQSAKQSQKEFSRVSPYFVAILMRQLDMCTVYPAVKIPLMSGCYKLLDLCDDHGVAQMNSMLSMGAREIFKTTFDLYKKFYRYTGKV